LVSIIVKTPFTLQYAKENIPESRWDHPSVKFVCYVTALLWFGIFALAVISQSIPVAMEVDVNSKIALIFGTILPIVIVVVGFKVSDNLVKYFQEKAKRAQGNVQGGDAPV